MTCTTRIDSKKRKVCIGDLNQKIKIQTREIKAPSGSSVDFDETFTDIKTVWSLVRTTRGSQLFDGVQISNPFTHEFFIRKILNVTFMDWVEYKSEKYDIVDVENINEDDEFLVLRCIKKGDKNKKANYS